MEPGEDVRRIQVTGRSTYIVSLPKKWVTALGLKAGSQIVVSKQNESLILTPKEIAKKQTNPTEATVMISNADDLGTIVRKIISLYLNGYNFIVLKNRENISTLQRNTVKDLVRRKLVGTEIVFETPNEIRLQTLMSYPELSVDSALKRICLITSSMHEDAIEALRRLDKKLAEEVIQTDDEVDRFSFYIIRLLKLAIQNEKILRDAGLSDPQDCLGYRVIVKFVERIADHAAKIAEHVLALEERPDEEVFQKIYEMSVFAKNTFERAIEALFKKDYFLADQVVLKARKISDLEREAIRVIQSKAKQSEITTTKMILERIRRTARYASDVAEIVLNLNVNQIIVTQSEK